MPEKYDAARRQLPRFLLAGAIGFGVDFGAFHVLAGFGLLLPLIARLVSIFLALSVTFAFNRTISFRSTAKGMAIASEFLRYVSASMAGAISNWFIFYICFTILRIDASVSIVIASAIALIINFSGYKLVVFK